MPRPIPVELYRPIIDNVEHRQDLVPLLTTSHIFKVEAERLLYRHLDLNFQQSSRQLSALKRISTCERVGGYVLSLTLRQLRAAECKPTTAALNSVPNLQVLCIYATCASFYPLPETPCFQLHTFRTNIRSPGNTSLLETFIHSQKAISTLIWNPRLLIPPVLPISDLPNLSTLSGPGDILRLILPGRSVKRVACEAHLSLLLHNLTTVFDTVQVLRVSSDDPIIDVGPTFPNLRFLEGRYFHTSAHQLITSVTSLQALMKLRLRWILPPSPSADLCTPLARSLFACQASLSVIEIRSERPEPRSPWAWRFRRVDEDGVEMLETMVLDSVNDSEWVEWDE